ncbi:MAG: DUF2723 domain-containing protein [Bacteroidales bacterium]|nr:DUF2723 domain-containing protein [Bacteroidales bacterium]
MTFKRLNTITGWLVAIIAAVVYFLTLEPTVSWWDCGEYISTAYKLQVGHPPGAPLFQMLGRFFSLFAGGDVTKVAMMVNVMSAICSALTIAFLFWTITMMARKVWMKEGEDAPWVNKIGVLLAGFVGAVAYTFTESFWFNAVEGEVYAMSSFFTAVTFWAILKWEQVADDPKSTRWIIFIAFLIGLSIGVHLLNLLCVPAFVYVVYFKKWKKTSFGGFVVAGLVSVVLLWFLNMFLVPQVINLAGKTELFFVNSLGAPFNVGAIVFFTVVIALIIFGLWFSAKKKHVIANTAILSLMFILIGYSSFFMLIIRANTNTPINENEPKEALSMLAYINRDQYGSWPLLYGPYYNAPVSDWVDGNPTYVKDKEAGKYVITDDNKRGKPELASEMKTFFPRMWSTQRGSHQQMYENYRKNKNGSITGENVRVRNYLGETVNVSKPTFGQNMKFFIDYQCNWMYWRYFMWNFVGRQNDIESQGELSHGNWISGINAIDSARLGDQSNIPASLKNPGRTTYYFLPLILGLIGLFWLLKKDWKQSWIIFLLFFMTGLAIVIYLNQTPNQPRERDYSYAGSFYAFAIWIGFGVIALIDWVNKLLKKESMVTVAAIGLICFLAVPCVLAANGWEEHNRSGKTSARDWARNYLAQLPPNSVIFTRGDNDTFPLWYVQEVEGFRTDVRVCNYMLSGGYWYVHQMGRKVYDSDPLPLTLTAKEYDNGVNESVLIEEEDYFKDKRVELKQIIDFIHNPKAVKRYPGGSYNYIPCRSVKLTVDKEACLRNGIVPESMADRIVDEIDWEIKDSRAIYKSGLMLLDFFATNNWERPVYFTSFSDMSNTLGIDKYLHMEGLAYRFIPVEAEDYVKAYRGGVYREGSYDLLVNKANEGIVKWGSLNQDGVVPDRESVRNMSYAQLAYSRLAQALVNHNQLDSAVIVMDKFQEFFPNEKFPVEIHTYQFPEMYYICGAIDKGDTYMRNLVDNYSDKVRYYGGMKPKFRKYYQEDIDEAMSLLKHFNGVAKKYNRNELAQDIEDRMMEYFTLYYDE